MENKNSRAPSRVSIAGSNNGGVISEGAGGAGVASMSRLQ
jgi:hypothetical protein